MATQKEVAAHLDLSQAAISHLVSAGIFKPANGRGTYSINDCRLAYIRHLREIAAGRSASDPDSPNLVLERARLARAQAVAQERKNLEAEGELISMTDAESVFFEEARTSRDAWLNWPSKVAPHIAAALNIPIEPLMNALEEHVYQQMADLSAPSLTEAMTKRGL